MTKRPRTMIQRAIARRRIAGIGWPAALAALLMAGAAFAQGGGGQGGLSPDTPVLAPTPPGPNSPGAPGPGAAPGGGAGANATSGPNSPSGPKTPLPPRDTPRAPQPGQSAGGDGPKTPLPPRDTPRAQQPGQKTATPDPDWPCVQVKVPTLSYGQMWAGPPLDDALKTWRDDEEVETLVGYLAARRTKMDGAKAAIDKFVKAAGPEKDAKLVKAFAGVFDSLNGERSQIITGIERYSRKQRELSERIKTESLRMAEQQKDLASQQTPEAQKQQQTLDWDTRIYDERAQSLNYVCETPVILEQRAFDLGREIQSRLSQTGQ